MFSSNLIFFQLFEFVLLTDKNETKLLKSFPNVLTLRIRMPISDDLHERNFITKITRYQKIVDIPNSMSVLHDLLPISVDMTKRRLTGVYNFVNPGVISHNEILQMYKDVSLRLFCCLSCFFVFFNS